MFINNFQFQGDSALNLGQKIKGTLGHHFATNYLVRFVQMTFSYFRDHKLLKIISIPTMSKLWSKVINNCATLKIVYVEVDLGVSTIFGFNLKHF